MIEDVRKWIEKEKLIEAGDIVIAGVSGGADSVCLLHVLCKLQERMAFSLYAVHVEHGIRGEESLEDAEFTKLLCKKQKVPCMVYQVDVPAYAYEQKIGLEEAARKLRYECYQKAAEYVRQERKTEKTSADGRPIVRIALAHHAEDNAETVLFQMIRGSGIDGLCGMQAKRELAPQVEIIRPLLTQSRQGIEDYLAELDQKFCVDSTNLNINYSRNRIRHHVLPELVQMNAQAVAHINQSAGLLQEVRGYLAEQIEILRKKSCVMEGEALFIREDGLRGVPDFMKREVIHEAIKVAAGSGKDITANHIEAVTALFGQQVGRRISLPYMLTARRTYEGIILEKMSLEHVPNQDAVFFEITAEQMEGMLDGAPLTIHANNVEICLRVLDFCGEMQEISKKRYTKWLDYDKIKRGLQIRNRESGDYLTISESGQRKRLKEYFINEKIPAEERDKVLLFSQGSHVVWVVGRRISAGYKVEQGTKRILEIQVSGGRYHED